jgi:hypothetical protein
MTSYVFEVRWGTGAFLQAVQDRYPGHFPHYSINNTKNIGFYRASAARSKDFGLASHLSSYSEWTTCQARDVSINFSFTA